MELLDDNLKASDRPSLEKSKEMFSLRKKHGAVIKAVNNARAAIGVVCFFSLIALIPVLQGVDDPLIIVVSLGLLVIYAIAAMISPKYARYSLSLASGMYALNILASFFIGLSYLIFFKLIVQGIIAYFLIKGTIAAFKLPILEKKLEYFGINS